MPRTTREWAKRKLKQARNNIDWSGTHLYQMYEVYNDPHPEIGKLLLNTMECLKLAQSGIEEVDKLI